VKDQETEFHQIPPIMVFQFLTVAQHRHREANSHFSILLRKGFEYSLA